MYRNGALTGLFGLLLIAASASCSQDPGSGLADTGGEAPSGLRRNQPAGLTVIDDYGFSDDVPSHPAGQFYEGPLGGSGWYVIDWGCGGCAIRRNTDDTAPGSPGAVLEEVYPPHLSGGGPSALYRDIPRMETLYVSWVVKWDAGFDHNSNSEKMIYFNPPGSNYFLFQFHWGSESIYNIAPAAKYFATDAALRANQEPYGVDGQGLPIARPVDGRWVEYEFLFEHATGRVRWWRDGELHADHTSRTFPLVDRIRLSSTWGGGGDKQGTHSRYTDHIFIAGN